MHWTNATPKQRHRPPHFLSGRHAFFITASTVERRPHLEPASRRDWFAELLLSRAASCGIVLAAWVVLREHYHAVLLPADEHMPQPLRWITAIHSESSLHWNREEMRPGRMVWYEYWDRTLWTEGDFWSRINYVHQNPVKHGYVSDPEDYPWSSLHDPRWCWDEPAARVSQERFPAPRKLPNDDF